MLCWAKNCREERDAPTQIIFDAADWRYCVLLLLGVWIKSHFKEYPDNDSNFVFNAVNDNCPLVIKESISTHLSQIMNVTEVDDLAADDVGSIRTHSLCRFAVTTARMCGISKDEVDIHGSWKSSTRIQDTYVDTTILYIDGKVTTTLCKGGPIAYDTLLSHTFLFVFN